MTGTISFLTTRSRKTNDVSRWEDLFRQISESIGADYLAGINRLITEAGHSDPFHVLVSTIISLRTRDEVTFPAATRLLQRADTPEKFLSLSLEEIEQLIYPAGFYRTKARNLLALSKVLVESRSGNVPSNVEELTDLPGVGRKTANLVLGLGFGIPAVCVDIHVHRISNRLGWVETSRPDQTETALTKIVPKKFWIPMNQWLVGFGQKICTPQSPRCSECPLESVCPKVAVTRRR